MNKYLAPEFTAVITAYEEEKSLQEYASRLLKVLRNSNRTFEVVIINDGSQDDTYDVARSLMSSNSEISNVVNFFSNAGQLAAMSCGVAIGSGQNFIFIDSDLQLEPEDLPKLLAEFDNGYDIVSGKRRLRKDSVFRRLPSVFANMLMAKVSGHVLTDYGCTFKIYRGNLVRPFNFGQYKPWKTAFVFKQAGKVIEVDVNHHARRYGTSGWTLSKLLGFMFDQVTGISKRPFLWIALMTLIFSVAVFVRMLLIPFFDFGLFSTISNGLLLNILFLMVMLQLGSTAFLGEYLFRVFNRTESDPIYTIKNHLARDAEGEAVEIEE